MYSPSKIELSKSALAKNIRFLRKEVGPRVKIASVVKGNAYGHGIEAFVPLAESCGIRTFAAFDAHEAYRTRACLREGSDVIIMGAVEGEALEWAVENGISFYVYELGRLRDCIEIARRVGKPARVHLEVETGLNRTGLDSKTLVEVIDLVLASSDLVEVAGICTHYAGAESIANYKRIQDQITLFDAQCTFIRSRGIGHGARHTAASAAAMSYPETRMDMVRIGIAQYGMWPSKETELQYVMRNHKDSRRRYVDPLKRVLRWRSRIMSVKAVDRGEFVGYGNTYLTTRPQRIAAVPIGYFHGFRRSLSNLGRVLVRGRRVGIVGTVNMNMILVNVSELPTVEIGDEVVIIGHQNKAQISVASFSDMSNLLNYEALVRLPSEIPRIVVA